MTPIAARYAGECAVTGRSYQPGARIEKTRFGWALSDQQTHDTLAAMEAAPIHISRGEGYGGSPFAVGEVRRERWHDPHAGPFGGAPRDGIVVILAANARYEAEDGMSFGVGDESGYVYRAWAREATAEEAAPVLAREAAAVARRRQAARVREIAAMIARDGTAPPPADGSLALVGERVLDTQDLYGGGGWFVVDEDGAGPHGPAIWHVRNNGGDGDDWSRNNIRTGGAGAIGRYVPYDAALVDELRRLDAGEDAQ